MNALKQLWNAFAALTANVNATSETFAEVNAKLRERFDLDDKEADALEQTNGRKRVTVK